MNSDEANCPKAASAQPEIAASGSPFPGPQCLRAAANCSQQRYKAQSHDWAVVRLQNCASPVSAHYISPNSAALMNGTTPLL